MPIKGDNVEQLTAVTSLEHHGVDVSIEGEVETVRAVVHKAVEMIDPESGMSTYGDLVEMLRSDLQVHTHGLQITVVATGEVLKLQKTLKDDGHIKQIEVTR